MCLGWSPSHRAGFARHGGKLPCPLCRYDRACPHRKPEHGRGRRRAIVCAKHLCGAATDYVLRAAVDSHARARRAARGAGAGHVLPPPLRVARLPQPAVPRAAGAVRAKHFAALCRVSPAGVSACRARPTRPRGALRTGAPSSGARPRTCSTRAARRVPARSRPRRGAADVRRQRRHARERAHRRDGPPLGSAAGTFE